MTRRIIIEERPPLELPLATTTIQLEEDHIKLIVDGQVKETIAIPKGENVLLTYPMDSMTSVETGDRYIHLNWSKQK